MFAPLRTVFALDGVAASHLLCAAGGFAVESFASRNGWNGFTSSKPVRQQNDFLQQRNNADCGGERL